MASCEKVTVDRNYFEALLRRADFHTSAQHLTRIDSANCSISRVEYDSLLRSSREYDLLKSALFQGGITAETLALLITGADNDHRKDSGVDMWAATSGAPGQPTMSSRPNVASQFHEMEWRTTGGASTPYNLAPGSGPFQHGHMQPRENHLAVPSLQRHPSYGMNSSIYDEQDLNDEEGSADHTNCGMSTAMQGKNQKRTLYFSGLSDRTTYRDLLSVIKGGKVLSVNMPSERSATVTFLDSAADFLTWAKRNDIYLLAKRIDVKWADRQFQLNNHIANKIANGATRNLVIHSAVEKGMTEQQIRDDMEHIHNLIVIDVVFRSGSAYVSMNSVHNALFARTCMMSRSTYKGCKIEFYRDECDVPLPAKTFVPKTVGVERMKKAAPVSNRFDMLNMDGSEGSSDEENRTPSDDDDDQTLDTTSHVGVSLNFLDSDSV